MSCGNTYNGITLVHHIYYTLLIHILSYFLSHAQKYNLCLLYWILVYKIRDIFDVRNITMNLLDDLSTSYFFRRGHSFIFSNTRREREQKKNNDECIHIYVLSEEALV